MPRIKEESQEKVKYDRRLKLFVLPIVMKPEKKLQLLKKR